MSEIIEEVDLGNGRRLLIYDDGSRQWVQGTTIEHTESAQSRDRGTTGRGGGSDFLQALRSVRDPAAIDPENPDDIAWLREQIRAGRITRESRPIIGVPPDQYLLISNNQGWGYFIGRRQRITYALQISAQFGDTPVYSGERYLWGVRGTQAARAAWRRDFIRSHPLGSIVTSRDTETALADSGIPPEAALTFRSSGEFSPADIPRGIMLISRAAMEADEDIGTYFERFVSRYNSDGVAGSIVAILAGIVEFAVRFIVGIVALPAAIQTLFTEARNILQSIQAALPDILQALQESPIETLTVLLQVVRDAIGQLTGISGIAEAASTGVDVAREGRDAESSLHITRATTRTLELILVVRGLINGIRRLPAIARRLRTQLRRINELLPRLRAARASSQSGAVVDAVEDATPRRRRSHSEPEVDDDLNIDEAITEDAAYGERESVDYDSSGRVRLRRSDGTSTRLDVERRALHRLQTQILTREQLAAARRIVGQRFNAQLRRLWRSIKNDLDRRDIAEIRRLLRMAERESLSPAVRRTLREGAYEIARNTLYPRMATRFWNAVRRRPRFAHIFESAGLQLRANRVPAWILPDGTEVRLSIEHITRVSDNPLLAADPGNFMIVPLAENSDLLEVIRAMSRFSEFSGG